MRGRGVIDEQIAYYRARAAEYDQTTGTGEGGPHEDAMAQVRAALEAFDPRGRVLEIAAGTGQWTSQLAAHASDVTAMDASPEMLTINAARTADSRVRYEVADAFDLDPAPVHDVVFFGFFLSHVPLESFDMFWGSVAGQLAAGGRVFVVDERRHGEWQEDWLDEDHGIVRRTLQDGTTHRAVKVLWDPSELQARLRGLGLTAAIGEAGPFFWCVATR